MPRALIIEGDRDSGREMAALLQRYSFDTLHVPLGRHGLLQIGHNQPDLLFVNEKLPDLRGDDVCEAVKLGRHSYAIPVIMVAAQLPSRKQITGYRVAADAYLVQPVSPDNVRHVISETHGLRQRLAREAVLHYVKIELISNSQYLHDINEIFDLLLRLTRFDDFQISQFRTALIEMGQNAIEWGNRFDPNKIVTITTRVLHDRVEVSIRDEGPGFNPRDLPHAAALDTDPTSHLTVREALGIRQGGFGIMMTHGLVDRVFYNQTGNEVTLIKQYAPVHANSYSMEG